MVRVITYGTYDLLHYGHIRLLERAKALGDYLIVGVTGDDYEDVYKRQGQGDRRRPGCWRQSFRRFWFCLYLNILISLWVPCGLFWEPQAFPGVRPCWRWRSLWVSPSIR